MMTRKIEIVPVDPRREQAQALKQALGQLIEEKVAEAMGGKDAIFHPFFQTKRLTTEIRRQQSVAEQAKFSHYYERWGCLAGCGATRETATHAGLGMCHACYRRIASRLKELVREHTPKEEPSFIDAVELARASLNPGIQMLPPPLEAQEKGRYYTQQEAATAAGIDPKTLYTWLRNGFVQPSMWIDKRCFWTDADVEELKLLKAKNRSLHNSKAAQARWGKKEIAL